MLQSIQSYESSRVGMNLWMGEQHGKNLKSRGQKKASYKNQEEDCACGQNG